MPDYVYKGAYPMVYPAEIGNGFEVHPAEGNPSTTGVGTTVVLHPLDVLHTTDPIPFHAWLEPEDGSEFVGVVDPESEPVTDVVPEEDAPPAKTLPSGPVPPAETTTPPVVATDPPVVPASAGDDTKEETK